MPIGVIPTFQPARVQPLDLTNPDIAGNIFRPIQAAQQINSSVLNDEIAKALLPYKLKMLQEQVDQIPLNNALQKLALQRQGVFTSPQIEGRPASVPAVPMNPVDVASVESSTAPSFPAGFIGPKPEEALAPDVTGQTGVRPPIILGNGVVFDPTTASENAKQQALQDVLKKQMEERAKVRDVAPGAGLITQDIFSGQPQEIYKAPEKPKTKEILVKNQKTGEVKTLSIPEGQTVQIPQGFEEEKTTEQRTRDSLAIEKAFDAKDEVKKFKEVSSNFRNVKQAVESAKTEPDLMAADNVLLDQFLKMANPKAVVRVGAIQTAIKAQSLLNGWKAKYARIIEGKGGFLAPEDRQAMLNMGTKIYQNDLNDYNAVREHFIKKYNLDEEDLPAVSSEEPSSVISSPKTASDYLKKFK